MQQYLGARALFEKQVDCIVRDDRTAQLQLYADDLLYEFPFAIDRPRRIESRDAFHKVMAPLWEQTRQAGVKLVEHSYEVHETGDPDFIVAELTFSAERGSDRIDVPFVQFFWTKGGRIVAVREYFSPRVRSEISE